MAEQHLDPKQVRKAVKALLAHRHQKTTSSLDLDAAAFTLQVGLKKAPVDPSPKPRLIPLPHRVRNDAGDRRGRLIVKDADKPWLKALLLDGERPGAKTQRTKLDGTRAAKMARRSESMREAGTNGDDLQIEGIHKVLAMSKLRTIIPSRFGKTLHIIHAPSSIRVESGNKPGHVEASFPMRSIAIVTP